jgi:hypothetical protein
MQPDLRAPGCVDRGRWLPGLAASEWLGDAWRAPVMPGSLDEQAAGMRAAGLGDRALAALGFRRVLRRHQAEVAGVLERGDLRGKGRQARPRRASVRCFRTASNAKRANPRRCYRKAARLDSRPRAGRSGARGRALNSGSLPLAGLLEMSVDRGARDVEDVCELLDGALARLVELLGEHDLFWVDLGASAALATSRASGGDPSRVLATISSRCSSARTESIPNIARPSGVAVSMPCSMTSTPSTRICAGCE